MKALLIEPVLDAPVLEPPLGLIVIATSANRRGHAVRATTLRFDSDHGRLGQLLRECPDVIGVSAHSMTLRATLDVVRLVRRMYPRTRIVVGGPHVSAVPEHTLAYLRPDFAVVGEGEESFGDLLDDLEAGGTGEGISGVIAASKPDHFLPRAAVANLDGVGCNRSVLDNFRLYLGVSAEGLMPDPCTTINVSRGCPARCVFCQPLVDTMFGRKMRRRSATSVREEVRYLQNTYGVASIQLVDDTVLVRTGWGRELARELKEAGLPWAINTRADLLDEDSIKVLADSGCVKVMLGVESGSQKVLDSLAKGVSVQQVHSALRLCRNHGVRVKASIMIGSPGETVEDLNLTLAMLQAFRPEAISVNYTKPTLGSKLFDDVCAGVDLDDTESVVALSDRQAVFPGLCEVSDDVLADYRARMLGCQRCG